MPKVSKKRQNCILKNCRQQFYRHPDDDDDDLDQNKFSNSERLEPVSADHNYVSEKNLCGLLRPFNKPEDQSEPDDEVSSDEEFHLAAEFEDETSCFDQSIDVRLLTKQPNTPPLLWTDS